MRCKWPVSRCHSRISSSEALPDGSLAGRSGGVLNHQPAACRATAHPFMAGMWKPFHDTGPCVSTHIGTAGKCTFIVMQMHDMKVILWMIGVKLNLDLGAAKLRQRFLEPLGPRYSRLCRCRGARSVGWPRFRSGAIHPQAHGRVYPAKSRNDLKPTGDLNKQEF